MRGTGSALCESQAGTKGARHLNGDSPQAEEDKTQREVHSGGEGRVKAQRDEPPREREQVDEEEDLQMAGGGQRQCKVR